LVLIDLRRQDGCVNPVATQAVALPVDADLDLDALSALAHGSAEPVVRPAVVRRLARNRRVFERAVAGGAPVYGVTTGFGGLVDAPVPPGADVARNLLRSHAAAPGGGQLARPLVRAAIAARAAVLARGHSGVRPAVVEGLAALLSRDVVPHVPCGPLGPTGDLAPAAHAYLVLIGEGETLDGRAGAEALTRAGLAPLALDAREALALISGTSFPAAIAALGALRARRVLDAADVAAALVLEALGGSPAALDPRVHALRRGLDGAARTAAGMRALLAGAPAHAGRLQDPYSLRAAPQIHGAARETAARFEALVTDELNSVTDNPLVFDAAPHIVSNGSFHGQALAAGCDALRAALADLAAVSERRTFRLVSPSLNGDLPGFLAPAAGAHSGYMIAQYTAASLVTELRLLAQPVATASVGVSDGQEDHASNAMLAAGALTVALDHAETVLAIELLCACQALDLRGAPGGRGSEVVRAIVREHVPALHRDRPPAPDIARVRALVAGGAFAAP
jgi:histidine ammonia-lyase